MHKNCRVMITGAGSGVGQGIIKSLKISKLPITLISADISIMNAGLYRTDESIIIPRVEEVGALESIIDILNQNNIDIVMIGSEFDLMFFSKNKNKIEDKTNALIFVAPVKTIEIADDKWITAQFLKENNLPYACIYSKECFKCSRKSRAAGLSLNSKSKIWNLIKRCSHYP